MNIIQLQDNLKNLSDQQLAQAVQMPSQDTPPFLVVSELNRRKKMRDSFQAQQADQNKTTVAQDVVAAAGVPQQAASAMAQSLAPKTDMANNTGIMSIPQGGEPQRMAGGGRVTKMYDGGGTGRAKPYMPTPVGVLNDPLLKVFADREGMTVSEYLQAMDPEARQAAITRAAARGTRDRLSSLEPATDTYNPITRVNPSYEEQLTSVFPPDPEPIRQRPDFENYGREGAPTMKERVYAARLPSLDDIIANDQAKYNNRIDVMMGSLPNMGERPPQWEDFYSANATNAVRPAYISGNAPINMGVVPEAAGTSALQAQREELAYNAQGDRAGPQTALPPPPQGQGAVSRSGLPIVGGGYDPLSVPGGVVDTFFTALGGATNEDMEKRAAQFAAKKSAEDAKAAVLATVPSNADPREANAMASQAAADKAAADKAAVLAATAAKGGSGQGGGGGGMGGGASGAPSTYEQALIDALANTEKKAKQDKWMALAQMGLSLMSSQQPNFGAALGEAGAAAIPAFQNARDTADAEKLKLQGGLYDIAMKRQARNDALAAASAKQQTSGAAGISAGGKRIFDIAKMGVDAAAADLQAYGVQPGQDVTDPALGLSKEAQIAVKEAQNRYISASQQFSALVAQLGLGAVGSTESLDPTAEVDVSE